jgi:hypothetical protein
VEFSGVEFNKLSDREKQHSDTILNLINERYLKAQPDETVENVQNEYPIRGLGKRSKE